MASPSISRIPPKESPTARINHPKTVSDSRHDLPIAPNLLNREFLTQAPNKAWVGDITYVWTAEGWLYLATVIDLFSRQVVGFALAVWDWAFGTLHIPARQSEVAAFGVGGEYEDYATVTRSLTRPFAKASEALRHRPAPLAGDVRTP